MSAITAKTATYFIHSVTTLATKFIGAFRLLHPEPHPGRSPQFISGAPAYKELLDVINTIHV